jgi:hypothetical protein
MGTVWRAHDDVLRREVAVKEIDIPKLDQVDDARFRERMCREARAAARLAHPNVITVYDVVEEDGQPWIIMQLVPGKSLADVIREQGPLPPAKVSRIGLTVLSALEAAHAAGIVHRDVKPGNVLLADDARVILTDFGIATLEGDPTLTSTGLLMGAPAYIAPERVRGLRPGPAADLWSLGATLFAAVEGRPPYERDTPLATLTAVINEDAPYPEHAGPLATVVRGLLERDPDRRLDATAARQLLRWAASEQDNRLDQRTVPLRPPSPIPAERTQVIARPAPEATSGSAPDDGDHGLLAGFPDDQESRPRWVRTALIALVAAAVIAALVAVVLKTATGGGHRAATSATANRSPASNASPSAGTGSAGGGAAPSAAPPSTGHQGPTGGASRVGGTGVPAGYTRYTDPSGFSVAVPVGWTKTRVRPGQLDFQDPSGSRYLRFGYTSMPHDDPKADWERLEPSVQQRLAGYHRISIEDVSYRGWPTADWQFTFGSSGQTRVIDRGFKVDESHGYAIYLSAPASDWQHSFTYFDVAARTFRPAP